MLENVPAAIGNALSGIRPGLGKLVFNKDEFAAAAATLTVTSDAFTPDGPMPARFTEDGARVSPPLRFGDVPAGTVSLALVVEDADSPTPAPLCHMLAWNMPASLGGYHEAALDVDGMPTARHGASFGKNSFMKAGWLPPDPPTGHGAHRYCFQLYALDRAIDLEDGSGRGALVEALTGHVLAKGMLIGTYERAG